jgi:hypothetical protein
MIDRIEFGKVLGYIALGIGKPIAETEDAAAGRMEVYYDALGDIPLDVLRAAAKLVIMEHKWATYPSAAEIREACRSIVADDPGVDEAAKHAFRIASKLDPDIQGPYMVDGRLYVSQWDYLTKDTPKRIVEAMRSFGVSRLTDPKEIVGVVRAQFCKLYEQIVQRDQRERLLPQDLKDEITRIKDVAKRIGKRPE